MPNPRDEICGCCGRFLPRGPMPLFAAADEAQLQPQDKPIADAENGTRSVVADSSPLRQPKPTASDFDYFAFFPYGYLF